jgi:cell division protein FtsB
MTHADGVLVGEVMKELAEAVSERLRQHDDEIAELKAEIDRLKREPRKTVAQRARERGAA